MRTRNSISTVHRRYYISLQKVHMSQTRACAAGTVGDSHLLSPEPISTPVYLPQCQHLAAPSIVMIFKYIICCLNKAAFFSFAYVTQVPALHQFKGELLLPSGGCCGYHIVECRRVCNPKIIRHGSWREPQDQLTNLILQRKKYILREAN